MNFKSVKHTYMYLLKCKCDFSDSQLPTRPFSRPVPQPGSPLVAAPIHPNPHEMVRGKGKWQTDHDKRTASWHGLWPVACPLAHGMSCHRCSVPCPIGCPMTHGMSYGPWHLLLPMARPVLMACPPMCCITTFPWLGPWIWPYPWPWPCTWPWA